MKTIIFDHVTRTFYIMLDGKVIDTAESRLEAELKAL
jgi:hypothetical protein